MNDHTPQDASEIDEFGIWRDDSEVSEKYSDEYHGLTRRTYNLLNQFKREVAEIDADPRYTSEGRIDAQTKLGEQYFEALRDDPAVLLAERLEKQVEYQRTRSVARHWPPHLPEGTDKNDSGNRAREIRDRLHKMDMNERNQYLKRAVEAEDVEFIRAAVGGPTSFPLYDDDMISVIRDAVVEAKQTDAERIVLAETEYAAAAMNNVVRTAASVLGIKPGASDDS